MTKSAIAIMLVLVAALSAGGGYWMGREHRGGDPEAEHDATTQPADEEKPVAEVTTSIVRRGSITQTLTAYGSVVAQPGDTRVISVPFEARVRRLLVVGGQQVAAGTELAQIEASPDALIALQEAKNAAAVAERDLKQTEQRFNDHLGTNVELSQSQQALESAKLKLNSLTERGVGAAQTIKAESSGIVSKLDVQEGQIVPAGGALLELASGEHIEVALGVEPDEVETLKAGQAVSLSTLSGSKTQVIAGQIRMVAQRVDPATRLATVLVSLPAGAHLMLDTYVSGTITRTSAEGLIVPRDAILTEEGASNAIFTIDGGVAKKHVIKIGAENGTEAEVIADEVKAGDPVVVVGSYVLEDGMKIQAKASPVQPAVSQGAR